jgi:hypothetical protein
VCIQASNISLQLLLVESFNLNHFSEQILEIIGLHDGTKIDPMKIEAIIQWLQPIDGKKMQRFIRATNFHRKFSHEFARVAILLNKYSNEKCIIYIMLQKLYY